MTDTSKEAVERLATCFDLPTGPSSVDSISTGPEGARLVAATLRALLAERDALRGALSIIKRQATAVPDETDEDRRRDLYRITRLARAALASEPRA